MKYLFCIFFLLIPFFSFADTETVFGNSGFFSQVMYYLDAIYNFFIVDIPNTISNFFTYVLVWIVKIRLESMLWTLEFSLSLARGFMDFTAYVQVVNTFLSYLPNDAKALASEFAIFQALTMVVEAYITRFIYRMIT